MAITVKPHQCLFDIALRESGSIASALDLAVRNGINLTDDLQGGQQLEVPAFEDINQRITGYYRERNIYPGTFITRQINEPQKGGIGFMGIGIDFKIS
ncbi:hypothetical protein [Chitinophaga solisilvae]|uniref:hypothetical protein n=1 Tax=Chitinophaga solisilvae TaxID=1233460 RepID=UPI001371520C|nr:hypothetical protein [Chitinophaga solisilvae]